MNIGLSRISTFISRSLIIKLLTFVQSGLESWHHYSSPVTSLFTCLFYKKWSTGSFLQSYYQGYMRSCTIVPSKMWLTFDVRSFCGLRFHAGHLQWKRPISGRRSLASFERRRHLGLRHGLWLRKTLLAKVVGFPSVWFSLWNFS
jgi:hypothetical protein